MKVKKYRKKPVEIEAIQLTDNYKQVVDVLKFIGYYNGKELNEFSQQHFDDYIWNIEFNGLDIHTLEGDIHASIGDFIIKGVNGEFYPCKPDIFKMTYEEVK